MLVLAALAPRAFGESVLPDLGGSGEAILSPQTERKLGESVVRDIRSQDPSYIDDPEIAEYLSELGAKLSAAGRARYDFQFFVMRDPTINAFALPGGFVGVHTGLITAADTESELASVLAHEMAHVTQRHISRRFGREQKLQIPTRAALAAASLLGRSRPDLATGAAAAVQAGTVQAQLAYSRDFEREADRVGLDTLEAAGFDTRAMPAFFEKMQKEMRIADDASLPGYLRTHPVTVERIADTQNKAAALPYHQHRDTQEFQLVRAKIRADAGDAQDALAHFQNAVREQRYASEAAARYGLATALLRANRARDAQAELARSRASGAASWMIELLAARIQDAQRDRAGAAATLAAARVKYPQSRAVLYAYVEELLANGKNPEALGALADAVRLYPGDARLHRLEAQCYAALGKRLLQHQAQAEYYALQGSLPSAIEQLQLARSAGDGDFYQLSVVDARLRQLRAEDAAERQDKER